MLINREINSLTKIEKEIIKNQFNLTHSLNGSIIKIRVRKPVYYLKKGTVQFLNVLFFFLGKINLISLIVS